MDETKRRPLWISKLDPRLAWPAAGLLVAAAGTAGWLVGSARFGVTVALLAAFVLSIAMLARTVRELDAKRCMLEDAEARVREALDETRCANDAKSRFIATASAGIRASLNLVVESLQRERAPAEIEDGIRTNLSRMLDDIQDFSDLEAGTLTLAARPFSPEAVTAAAVTAIEAQTRAKGLTIVAIPSPGLPKFLLGDASRIGQILFGLTSIAVKATARGGISLQVLCPGRRDGRATIEWVVTDRGSGRNGTERGFGLEMCERLVARMGGTLSVDSTAGEGSRFRVRLEFGMAPSMVTDTAEVPASAARLRSLLRAMGRRPMVLIAEDTPAGQFAMRQLLAREGIAPEVVSDGLAAVLRAEAECYDVICMDLRMPELDGLAAARRIRAGRGASAKTPIIAITASATAEDIQACREAGMNLFVAKPVGRETLLNAILTALTDPAAEPCTACARQSAA